MVVTMKNEYFGSCTNHGECEAVCPKQIPLEFIGRMNRDLVRAVRHRHREPLIIPCVVQAPSTEDLHEPFHNGASSLPQQQAPLAAHEGAHAETESRSPEPAGARQ